MKHWAIKGVKFVVGLGLIPACLAATRTVVILIQAVRPESSQVLPPGGIALGVGLLAWLFLYYTMPRPVRSYILAHELTHALWGVMMGASVSRLRVAETHGSVELSKSNFLITLAPYFFPLYTVLVVIIYYVVTLFVDVGDYYLFWLGAVGFTWGFHFTFTVGALCQHQPDIRTHGHLFSYTVIYLMNALGIALWTVMVSTVTLEEFVTVAEKQTSFVYRTVKDTVERHAGNADHSAAE